MTEDVSAVYIAALNISPMINTSTRTANFHYAIRNLARVAERRERAGHKVIYLNIGDPQRYGFRPPAAVIERVAHALRGDFTGYSPSAGLLEAREAIAAYATNLGAPTGPHEVLITAGASEAADMLLTALLNEGEEVLLPAPGYPLYPAILNKLGAVARPYRLDGERKWQPCLDEVRSSINSQTRALILINPNNPTGSIVPDDSVRQLLEVAAEHKLLVIADEVYRELCFGESPTPSSVIAEAIGTPLVTLESLSKTHMVPGWRIGWMRFTHAEKMTSLIAALHRLADGRLCSPTPAQYAVRPALEGSKDYLRDFIRELKKRCDLAVAHIERMEDLSCQYPEAAFYMMIKVHDLGGRTDERFVLDLLDETGLLVVHGSGFGANPHEGYFRIVYLASEETLDEAFKGIRDSLARHQMR